MTTHHPDGAPGLALSGEQPTDRLVHAVVVQALGQGLEHRQAEGVLPEAVEVGEDVRVQRVAGVACGIAAPVAGHQLVGAVQAQPVGLVGHADQRREDHAARGGDVRRHRRIDGAAQQHGAAGGGAQQGLGQAAQVDLPDHGVVDAAAFFDGSEHRGFVLQLNGHRYLVRAGDLTVECWTLSRAGAWAGRCGRG